MKRLAVLVVVLSMVIPITFWAFAQEQKTVTWEEHLILARANAQAQIAARRSQIQRLQDQIQIWENQLATINAELKSIADQKKKEKNPKDDPKKSK